MHDNITHTQDKDSVAEAAVDEVRELRREKHLLQSQVTRLCAFCVVCVCNVYLICTDGKEYAAAAGCAFMCPCRVPMVVCVCV